MTVDFISETQTVIGSVKPLRSLMLPNCSLHGAENDKRYCSYIVMAYGTVYNNMKRAQQVTTTVLFCFIIICILPTLWQFYTLPTIRVYVTSSCRHNHIIIPFLINIVLYTWRAQLILSWWEKCPGWFVDMHYSIF